MNKDIIFRKELHAFGMLIFPLRFAMLTVCPFLMFGGLVSALFLITIPQFFITPTSHADEITAGSPTAFSVVGPSQSAKLEIAANVPPFQLATTQIVVSISFNREPKGDFFLEVNFVDVAILFQVGQQAIKVACADPILV
jgi:hypothetical protein